MDLLKDNLQKLYFRFLIPSLGSAMVMSIYTLTDAIVIGKGVGSDALAALSITTPLSSGGSIFQLYCHICPGRQ